ncbi:23S rRNA (adenine(2503)-C(2))-methyltransferase RlmN [Saprospiraceae bacterium]|nr:23S rRNA (adenine(2503)-C(2))-methyltransferase RlmN [Saprospiraceae bacterium]
MKSEKLGKSIFRYKSYTFATMEKLDIRKLSLEQITELIQSIGESAFRAKQIFSWIWQKSARSIDEMTNLSKALREKLNEGYEIRCIKVDTVQYSDDGTIKSRFQLHDGHMIESVLIPVKRQNRYTVCVSSQVGCSLSCTFCATGKMKRLRNLDPGEIYDQVVMVNKQAMERFEHPLTNIVYMGMGEPLLAYKNVLESIHHITGEHGLHMSPRRITVSTAGIAKMIRKLADDDVKFNLALSLHAADDTKRNEIMPINEQNTLDILMDAIKYFHDKTGNRISYEYIAFDGFNDTQQDAMNLVKLCKIFPVKVNIIEYNPVEGVTLTKSAEEQTDKFAATLERHGVTVTIRRSRGKDIDAACGQLANK